MGKYIGVLGSYGQVVKLYRESDGKLALNLTDTSYRGDYDNSVSNGKNNDIIVGAYDGNNTRYDYAGNILTKFWNTGADFGVNRYSGKSAIDSAGNMYKYSSSLNNGNTRILKCTPAGVISEFCVITGASSGANMGNIVATTVNGTECILFWASSGSVGLRQIGLDGSILADLTPVGASSSHFMMETQDYVCLIYQYGTGTCFKMVKSTGVWSEISAVDMGSPFLSDGVPFGIQGNVGYFRVDNGAAMTRFDFDTDTFDAGYNYSALNLDTTIGDWTYRLLHPDYNSSFYYAIHTEPNIVYGEIRRYVASTYTVGAPGSPKGVAFAKLNVSDFANPVILGIFDPSDQQFYDTRFAGMGLVTTQNDYQISGVVQSGGSPLANAVVSILNKDGVNVCSTTTNGSGQYVLPCLSNAPRRVCVVNPTTGAARIHDSVVPTLVV